jgi:hypothetical protein
MHDPSFEQPREFLPLRKRAEIRCHRARAWSLRLSVAAAQAAPELSVFDSLASNAAASVVRRVRERGLEGARHDAPIGVAADPLPEPNSPRGLSCGEAGQSTAGQERAVWTEEPLRPLRPPCTGRAEPVLLPTESRDRSRMAGHSREAGRHAGTCRQHTNPPMRPSVQWARCRTASMRALLLRRPSLSQRVDLNRQLRRG